MENKQNALIEGGGQMRVTFIICIYQRTVFVRRNMVCIIQFHQLKCSLLLVNHPRKCLPPMVDLFCYPGDRYSVM